VYAQCRPSLSTGPSTATWRTQSLRCGAFCDVSERGQGSDRLLQRCANVSPPLVHDGPRNARGQPGYAASGLPIGVAPARRFRLGRIGCGVLGIGTAHLRRIPFGCRPRAARHHLAGHRPDADPVGAGNGARTVHVLAGAQPTTKTRQTIGLPSRSRWWRATRERRWSHRGASLPRRPRTCRSGRGDHPRCPRTPRRAAC
jgi:hypothetical protein